MLIFSINELNNFKGISVSLLLKSTPYSEERISLSYQLEGRVILLIVVRVLGAACSILALVLGHVPDSQMNTIQRFRSEPQTEWYISWILFPSKWSRVKSPPILISCTSPVRDLPQPVRFRKRLVRLNKWSCCIKSSKKWFNFQQYPLSPYPWTGRGWCWGPSPWGCPGWTEARILHSFCLLYALKWFK